MSTSAYEDVAQICDLALYFPEFLQRTLSDFHLAFMPSYNHISAAEHDLQNVFVERLEVLWARPLTVETLVWQGDYAQTGGAGVRLRTPPGLIA